MNEWELLDFIDGESEHDLFESINSEYTDIAGFPIKYYIKTDLTENGDILYGENTLSTFTSGGYRTKIVYEPTEEASILDVFGFSPEESIQFAMMPKWIFKRDVAIPYGNSNLYPMVGDVILTLWNDHKYEITNVGSEQSIFQGKKMIWEFTLTPFRYSEEGDGAEGIIDYQTNISDFPDINDEGVLTKELSGYGENQTINDYSDEIDEDIDEDKSIYGY